MRLETEPGQAHEYGCRVVQKLLGRREVDENLLVKPLVEKCVGLSKSQFGNYVVTDLFLCWPAYSPHIIDLLIPAMPDLAVCRFGNHIALQVLNMITLKQAADIQKRFWSQCSRRLVWLLHGFQNIIAFLFRTAQEYIQSYKMSGSFTQKHRLLSISSSIATAATW